MNITATKYNFAPIYVPLLHDKNSTKILYGSRGSGKSDFACQKMVINCLTLPYFKCLMVRKHKENVKKSLYDTVEAVIKRMGLEAFFEFKEHKTEIVCHNGNKFMPLGLYESAGNTGKGKSILNPTHAIVDELDECTEDEFEKLWFSLRGSNNIELFGIFNTHRVDEDFWIFTRWFPARETFEKLDGSHTYIKSRRKNTTILHTTYLMNPFCTDEYLERFEDQKLHAYERYEISGLGLIKVIKQSNLALKAFNRVEHVSDSVEFNSEALIYLSWDFNRLPHHTVGLWQFGGYDSKTHEYRWNLVKEFCLEDHSVREVQEQINKYIKSKGYKSKKICIVCDFSGNTKRDHDAKSDINKIKTQIKKDGFQVDDRTRVNPSVIASLDFLNDIFDGFVKLSKMNQKYGGATIKIQIAPDCKFHIADFEKTKTDKDGKILKITKKDTFIEDGARVSRTYQARGHAVDGTRYIMTTVFNFEYGMHKSA